MTSFDRETNFARRIQPIADRAFYGVFVPIIVLAYFAITIPGIIGFIRYFL